MQSPDEHVQISPSDVPLFIFEREKIQVARFFINKGEDKGISFSS